jgi:hypothetical protein
MNYTRTAVYDRVVDAILAEYPNAYCTSRYVLKQAKFPACYIHEIDNSRPLQNVQLDFQDVQWESVFEIQVVSTKAGSSAAEAYAIMELAKAEFTKLYYREFSETNIDTGDKFTLVGRFRRIIGGGDVMPPTISA